MEKSTSEYLNVAEVATLLGLRPVTIYRWCRAGRLASVKIGKEWRIRRAALDELLGRSRRDTLDDHDDGGKPMHEVSVEAQDIAQRLLLQEAGDSHEPATLALASERVCDRLRQRLVPLIGRIGFAALLRRALHLAQGDFPSLAPLTIDDGADPSIMGAHPFATAHAADPALVERALTAILAHFVTLLSTFIGEVLTRRVVGEYRPTRADGTETAR